MTEPSEAAKRRACEILKYACDPRHYDKIDSVMRLATHLDAEDKAAREFLELYMAYTRVSDVHEFARRHILPESRPTVQDILRKRLMGSEIGYEETEQALRDAGRLKETDCD